MERKALLLFLCQIFLDNQIVNDETLTLHGVLAHIVFQEGIDIVALVECYRFQAHIGTDEMFKLIRRNFAQTFKTGDFGVGAEPLDGGEFLFVGIAIDGSEL